MGWRVLPRRDTKVRRRSVATAFGRRAKFKAAAHWWRSVAYPERIGAQRTEPGSNLILFFKTEALSECLQTLLDQNKPLPLKARLTVLPIKTNRFQNQTKRYPLP